MVFSVCSFVSSVDYELLEGSDCSALQLKCPEVSSTVHQKKKWGNLLFISFPITRIFLHWEEGLARLDETHFQSLSIGKDAFPPASVCRWMNKAALRLCDFVFILF